MSNCFIAPLECRCQKPAEGEHQPPEECSYHGVVEYAEDEETRHVCPVPGDGDADKLITRAGHQWTSKEEREYVTSGMNVEGKSKIDDGPPGVVESGRVQEEGEEGHKCGYEAAGGPEGNPPFCKDPLCLSKIAIFTNRTSSISSIGGRTVTTLSGIFEFVCSISRFSSQGSYRWGVYYFQHQRVIPQNAVSSNAVSIAVEQAGDVEFRASR